MYQQFNNGSTGSLVQIGSKPTSALENGALLSSYTLRISVLEQCHYHCLYCEPGATKPFMSKKQWLTVEQHQKLTSTFQNIPLTKIRFTGGEPLLRRDLPELIDVWQKAFPKALMTMTTNGNKLVSKAKGLKEADLRQITFHLDTLRPHRYAQLMGPGNLHQILEQIRLARDNFENTKINMVLQKGLNDDEIFDFLAFSKREGVQVRFIELIDTSSAPRHVQKTFLSQKELLERLEEKELLKKRPRAEPADPAALFHLTSDDVHFGVIASDTEPFCDDCNRLRLSADGFLRGCLYEPNGVALKPALDKKLPMEQLQVILQEAILQKTSYHPSAGLGRVPFSMAQVGG